MGLYLSSEPVGSMKDYGGSVLPSNYLPCNGASIPVVSYPALFAIIGYTYGGAGANFNIPDSRGAASIGEGTGVYAGATARARGPGIIGLENHQLSNPELANHLHTAFTNSTFDHGHTIPSGGAHTHNIGNRRGGDDDNIPGCGNVTDTYVNNSTGTTGSSHTHGVAGAGGHGHAVTINTSGSNTPHNTMQPSLVVNKMIRF